MPTGRVKPQLPSATIAHQPPMRHRSLLNSVGQGARLISRPCGTETSRSSTFQQASAPHLTAIYRVPQTLNQNPFRENRCPGSGPACAIPLWWRASTIPFEAGDAGRLLLGRLCSADFEKGSRLLPTKVAPGRRRNGSVKISRLSQMGCRTWRGIGHRRLGPRATSWTLRVSHREPTQPRR